MKILNSIESINNFIEENRFVLLYFFSDDCNVCSALLPKVEEILNEYPNTKAAKIDIKNIPMAVGTFNVFTLPCISVFIDKKEVIREARFISADELKKKIKRYYSIVF